MKKNALVGTKMTKHFGNIFINDLRSLGISFYQIAGIWLLFSVLRINHSLLYLY